MPPVSDCVDFLQWALPRLSMRWAGFRKVRGQVCKRIRRRMVEVGLSGFSDYRRRLEAHPEEWQVLDTLCRITISRFYRDRRAFHLLEHRILPDSGAFARGGTVRCWSAGCAFGEEPSGILRRGALSIPAPSAAHPLHPDRMQPGSGQPSV